MLIFRVFSQARPWGDSKGALEIRGGVNTLFSLVGSFGLECTVQFGGFFSRLVQGDSEGARGINGRFTT